MIRRITRSATPMPRRPWNHQTNALAFQPVVKLDLQANVCYARPNFNFQSNWCLKNELVEFLVTRCRDILEMMQNSSHFI
ncbi:hypothetical protein PR048_029521 [Dryococelus australis]|uniref:Uncharacterized protein n=1 Tax=Dryococelus australis TaxID=614101 RepID=A0ABQ9GDY9_9NEOP|nr:hypothetical protein PR048_029521 [Dryococelus australis]